MKNPWKSFACILLIVQMFTIPTLIYTRQQLEYKKEAYSDLWDEWYDLKYGDGPATGMTPEETIEWWKEYNETYGYVTESTQKILDMYDSIGDEGGNQQ